MYEPETIFPCGAGVVSQPLKGFVVLYHRIVKHLIRGKYVGDANQIQREIQCRISLDLVLFKRGL